MDKINMASFFSSCCGCISLRTGCFIIGYTYLVLDTIASVILGLTAATFVTAVLDTQEREKEVAAIAALLIISVLLVLALIMLAFIIALLVGLHKKKRGAILAFLVGSAIFVILDLVTLCVGCSYHLPTATIVFRVVVLVLQIVFFLVIRNYYNKMETAKGTMINTA